MISMDKFYSYADFLKGIGQYTEGTQHEQFLNEIYLDLFLNRLGRLQRIEQLEKLIDRSLDKRNKVDFMKYTEELKLLKVN